MKAGGQSLKPEERAFCFPAWIHPVSRFFSDAPQKTPAGSFLLRRLFISRRIGLGDTSNFLTEYDGKERKTIIGG
jgi:hypothetical protein